MAGEYDRELGAITTKIENLHEGLSELRTETRSGLLKIENSINEWPKTCSPKMEGHEKRIRKLENWRWYVLGIIACASVFLGILLELRR